MLPLVILVSRSCVGSRGWPRRTYSLSLRTVGVRLRLLQVVLAGSVGAWMILAGSANKLTVPV